MKKIGFIFCLIVLGTSSVFAQLWDSSFYMERAEQYRLQGNYEKALELYNTVLAREPENVKALNGRGVVYQRRGEYLKAKADFQFAITLNPAAAESHHNLESVNERLRNSTGVLAGDYGYQDAARYLGTNEYAIQGAMPAAEQAPSAPAYYGTIQYPPATQYPQGAAQNPPTANSYTLTTPSNQSSQISSGGMSSIYDRTVYSVSPQTSLYDRTAAQVPGVQVDRYTTPYLSPSPSSGGMNPVVVPQTQLQSGTRSAFTTAPVQPYTQTYNTTIPSERLPRASAQIVVPRPLPQNTIVPAAPVTATQSMRYTTAPVYGADSNTGAYYERLILAYTDIIIRNPGMAIAYNNRGVAYAKLQDWLHALEDFNQALLLNPYYHDAQANREQVKYLMVNR